MLINKNEQNQEQQGFIKDKQLIQIDYKCMFNSLPRHIRRNPFMKKYNHKQSINFKYIQSIQNIKSSPFINQNKRIQVLQNILQKHQKSVIFNGFNNQIAHNQTNLIFDSNFSMGNLEIVTRVKNNQYDLYMRPDTNTQSNYQWFYFRVHIKKKKKVKFTIKNFIKATMLYSKGLRPFYLSKCQEKGKYQQIKQQVQFYQDTQTQYFNLSFIYDFKFDNDEVQFCSQPPYGFQDLEKSLLKLKNIKRYNLGKTILGNKIPYFIINQKEQSKVICVAIARQHPGQAVSSWMMEGFMREIQKCKFSNLIKWIIIPMINIDGVQLGNNRTGVLGHDFNRNWNIQQNSKKQKMFPQVAAILNYMRKLKKKYPKKTKMFLDLHGHSSQPNVFTYGPPHSQKTDFYFMSRMFPQVLAKKNENFSLAQSSYVILNEKKNAARSIVFQELKVPFTYTIQCTFGVMNGKQITSDEIIKVGEDIAVSANQFIENLFLKDVPTNNNILLQSIKEKYINNQDETDQYQTASQQSQSNQKRQQFEKNIQNLLEIKQQKRTQQIKRLRSETLDSKIGDRKLSRKISQSNNCLKPVNFQIGQQNLNFSVDSSTAAVKKKNRIATQECQPSIYNECAFFPPIKNRTIEKRQKVGGILNRFHTQGAKQPQGPGVMNMKQIQQRLFKLRNSKIGKRILVINAYGV